MLCNLAEQDEALPLGGWRARPSPRPFPASPARTAPETALAESKNGFVYVAKLCLRGSGPRGHEANLPGWCWAQILQSALVGLSSSLHTEVCNAVRFSDGVIHSRIS